MHDLKSQFEYLKSLTPQELLAKMKELDSKMPKVTFAQTDKEVAWLEVLAESKANK